MDRELDRMRRQLITRESLEELSRELLREVDKRIQLGNSVGTSDSDDPSISLAGATPASPDPRPKSIAPRRPRTRTSQGIEEEVSDATLSPSREDDERSVRQQTPEAEKSPGTQRWELTPGWSTPAWKTLVTYVTACMRKQNVQVQKDPNTWIEDLEPRMSPNTTVKYQIAFLTPHGPTEPKHLKYHSRSGRSESETPFLLISWEDDGKRWFTILPPIRREGMDLGIRTRPALKVLYGHGGLERMVAIEELPLLRRVDDNTLFIERRGTAKLVESSGQ